MSLKTGLNLALMCVLLLALPTTGGVLIDPTRPVSQGRSMPVRPATVQSGWTLNSTLVAPTRRVAVINGKRVSEGESVDGARVIEIRKLDVLIQTTGKRITLQLLPDIVRKQP